MKTIKWGIMATGNIAEKLAEAISFSENSVLYAVASRSCEKAEQFAARFSAVKHYGSYEELAKDSDIDIAVVVDKIPGDYLNTMTTLWRLTRSVNHDIEPVLLTAADDESGFLSTVQKTGIAV